MRLVILRFWSDNAGDCGDVLVNTKLHIGEIQKEVEDIIKQFELGYNLKWNVDDIIEVLRNKKLIAEVIDTKQYMIEI